MSTYKAKNPCRCGSFARDTTTKRCVPCEKGRKEAAYNRTLVNHNPNTANSGTDRVLQLKKWENEDHQVRMEAKRAGGMV